MIYRIIHDLNSESRGVNGGRVAVAVRLRLQPRRAVLDEQHERAQPRLKIQIRTGGLRFEGQAGGVIEERNRTRRIREINAQIQLEFGSEQERDFTRGADAEKIRKTREAEIRQAEVEAQGLGEARSKRQINTDRVTIKRQFDGRVIRLRPARGFRHEDVFNQLFDRLERLAGIVLEGLHLLCKGIRQRQQVADAAIHERKLLIKEAQGFDAPEICDDALQGINELPEAQMLEVEQHVQVLQLHVERCGTRDVRPGDQDARLRIECDARDRRRQPHRQREVRKSREGRPVNQACEVVETAEQFGEGDASGRAGLSVRVFERERERALNRARSVINAYFDEIEEPRQRINVSGSEVHGPAHRRIDHKEMARERIVVTRIVWRRVGSKWREINSEGERDADRRVHAQLAAALDSGNFA